MTVMLRFERPPGGFFPRQADVAMALMSLACPAAFAGSPPSP
ncbi:uncharacterized protein CMC5_075430 [Chondromyces crocatus]|uniref:Uncharacterized protein n=1 Tax=Chondromyces crocatus TaxID=52 RepID=A0A0K1ER36_CHOCO|nr:uncharacterized protein CMC5_075430 [Chondromyces crocatus]